MKNQKYKLNKACLGQHFSTTETGRGNKTKKVLSKTRKISKIQDFTNFTVFIFKNKTGSMRNGTKFFLENMKKDQTKKRLRTTSLDYSIIIEVMLFDLLLKNKEPITKQTDATPMGYHNPANGSPIGLSWVLVYSIINNPINGTSPPNTPLPIW